MDVPDIPEMRRDRLIIRDMAEEESTAIRLAPGEGAAIRNPVGGPLTFKVRGEETNGTLTVFESIVARGEGPPLHAHADEHEVVYVLEGTLRLKLEDQIQPAPAGAFAFIPRGCPHTWQNVGESSARILVIFTPAAAGMETFFERFVSDGAPILESFRALGSAAGMDVLGPPLAESDPL